MTNNDLANLTGVGPVRRVELSVLLQASIDVVWKAITDIEEVKQWWDDWQDGGIIEVREGGRVMLDDGSWVNGTVKICLPPYVFEYSFNDVVENNDSSRWLESQTRNLLRFDLIEVDEDKTRLTLLTYTTEHAVIGCAAGWHHFAIERLRSYLENDYIIDPPGRFEELKAIYRENNSKSRISNYI